MDIVDLHIEWCKSKAWAEHWSEEVELLQEEMRRVKAFFEARAGAWDQQRNGLGKRGDDPAIIGGMEAYARNQAAQFRAMRAHCEHTWRLVDEYVHGFGQGPTVPPEIGGESSNQGVEE